MQRSPANGRNFSRQWREYLPLPNSPTTGWSFPLPLDRVTATSESLSYPQLLEVLLDGLRQPNGFGVEVFQFDVDFPQGLLEIKILVHLLGRDADERPGVRVQSLASISATSTSLTKP